MKINRKIDKYPDFVWELKKVEEQESDSDTNYSYCPQNNPQEYGKETGWTGDQRKNRKYPDHSIAVVWFRFGFFCLMVYRPSKVI